MQQTPDLRVATPSSTAYRRRWWALGVLCLSLVVLGMDNTILNVTLPTLARDLGATASQLQAGVRILPIATLILAAPLAARLTERIGTKLVVAAGLLVVAGALWLLSTVQLSDGYGPVAAALALLGAGMGLTMAPATESIMGSLPLAKAGVGSAMNDTTRQVGGALGVAVLGSILAASYAAAIQPALRDAPPPIAQTAGDSIGAATTIAARLGPQGQDLLDAARTAFLQGMGDALQVGAGVAVVAALLVLLFLPARATASSTEESGVAEVAEIQTAEAQGQPRG